MHLMHYGQNRGIKKNVNQVKGINFAEIGEISSIVQATASIWFEIWGVVDQGKEIFNLFKFRFS